MGAQLIEGDKVAKEIRAELKQEIQNLEEEGISPHLSVILDGEDKASKTYVKMK